MRVVVLDGNENQAVACVRALARSGHTVVVGADTPWSKAGLSRFSHETFTYPAPQTSAEEFVQYLVALARKVPGTLILPMTERTSLPLSLHRKEIFGVGGKLIFPSHETLLRAFDKHQTTALAKSLGIAVPKTTVIANDSEVKAIIDSPSTRYPLVLKPRTSEEISERGEVVATGAPVYVKERDEFFPTYHKLKQRCSSMLVQEFIEGQGIGYFALMKEGHLQAEFAHKRLRDVRPTGSGSSLRESAKPNHQVREASLAILSALGWSGVAMVEFRQRPDGTPVFLEVNGRFWNSLPLAIYAGVDFPTLLVRMAEGQEINSPPDYKIGVRCRWLLGDFRHLVEVFRGAPVGYPGKFPSRLSTLFKFLLPVPGTFHDNFTLRDPLPEAGDWLNFAFRKLPSRFKAKAVTKKDIDVQRDYSLP